tara:strand:- start:319 stop:1335 length:1017 start_codon:yes stop_codon:yes gene_type:complete
MNVLSLFSGCGGIDLGFKKAGFNTVLAIDKDKDSCNTLIKNGLSKQVICADVKNLKISKILKKKIDILVAGPPCPPYSKSRFYLKNKKRALQDENSYTLDFYCQVISKLKPKIFFFENVFGFYYKPHREAFNLLKRTAEKSGYNIEHKVINFADYGVPQIRERFICIGTKKKLKKFKFPPITHSKKISKLNGIKPWVTCKDVIGDLDYPLLEDKINQAGSKDKNLLKLVPPGDNYLYFTKKRGYKKPLFKWRSRYWSFLLKLSPKKPSWTIQASFSNNMGPFHWRNRFLRISEIKRIQTFNENFKLSGDFRSQWRQIGNAVPPLFSQIIAKKIKIDYF